MNVNYDDIIEFLKDIKPAEPELTQDQVDKYLYERNLVAVDAMMVHQLGKKAGKDFNNIGSYDINSSYPDKEEQ